MPRLRRVSPRSRGWTRRRVGRGFTYTDAAGVKLGPDEVARIKALAIPPAWRDVWISPYENGHIQAVGTDDAGRRQYLYHPAWREKRDRSKFERVQSAAALFPQAREQVLADMARSGMPLERAAAVAVRLLDVGYFRIGNMAYTDANGSFGLTTLERQHVRARQGALVFTFVGKAGIEHVISIVDSGVVTALKVLRGRRDASQRLLAYQRERGRWIDLDSTAVNAYLSGLFGGGMTAKDFRTWHATVIAAESLALSEEPGITKKSRQAAIKQAVLEVSEYLGNTPTIARSSYIDPRVIDLYESGTTIADAARAAYPSPEKRQQALESAVLDLLT